MRSGLERKEQLGRSMWLEQAINTQHGVNASSCLGKLMRKQGLALSSRLERSGAVTAHCILRLLGSSDPPPASQVAETTDMYHHTQIIFGFFFFNLEGWGFTMLLRLMGFHHDGQADLELLTSGDPPTSASQSARITGVVQVDQGAGVEDIVLTYEIRKTNRSEAAMAFVPMPNFRSRVSRIAEAFVFSWTEI
ncbi:hypothetical protein AAY473_015785 [Plecturocebus cupreus]